MTFDGGATMLEVGVDKAEVYAEVKMVLRVILPVGSWSTSGKLENTFLTFLTCYKCKKYSFKKVGAT